MTAKLIKNLGLFFLTLTSTVSGGGTLPVGYGNTYGGHTYLPKSNDEVTWSSYGAPLTDPVLRDILAVATASMDRETQGFRLLHEMHPEFSDYHVYFSFVGGAPDPGCGDGKPGGCPLGLHTCLQWTVDGPYRMCSQARIRIWTSNIAVDGPLYDRLGNILRHEWSHALGYHDGVGGPTDNGSKSFTECQLAQMENYHYDSSTVGWTAVELEECE
jgi:hypothetical protein